MLAQGRKKTFLLGTISSFGNIIVSIIVAVIAVPVGLHYFGLVRYGVWMVLSSIITYLGISNFGIGAALITFIAKSHDSSERRVILRRSIGILTASSVVFIFSILCVAWFYPEWVTLLGKIPVGIQGEASKAALILSVLFLLQLPITVFAPVFSGFQKVHWDRVYKVLNAITTLGALFATVLVRGNLITLALFTGLGKFGVAILCGFHLFFAHPDMRFRLGEQADHAPSTWFIFSSGFRFFLMGIAVLVIYSTDNLIISHYLGPQAVSPYAVTFRLFSLGFIMITTGNSVLWPMYSHAAAAGQWEWVRPIYNYSCQMLVILGGLLWVGGILFSEGIISLWVGPAAYGGLLVAIALGGYGYVLSLGNTQVMLLNGLDRNRNVIFVGALEAVLNLVISLTLVRSLGIGGVALGTFLAALLTSFWLLPLVTKHQTEGKVSLHIKPIAVHAVAVVFPCTVLAILVNIYIGSNYIKFLIGCFLMAVYLMLSWCVIPQELKSLIRNMLWKMYTRRKRMRTSVI